MHTSWIRAQLVVTLSLAILAAICGFASFTDMLQRSSPLVDIQIGRIEAFHRQAGGGDDEVKLLLYITTDFRPVFSWNTKQVFVTLVAEYEGPNKTSSQISLWDAFHENKEDATFQGWTRNKYGFVDKGHNLRGLAFNLTMSWDVLPKLGVIFSERTVVSSRRLPDDYLQLKGTTAK